MSEALLELPTATVLQVFPRIWLSGLMQPTYVGEYCGDYEPAGSEATLAVMGMGWSATKLERHVEVSGAAVNAERWGVPPSAWRMVVYRAHDTSEADPIGFVVFRPVLAVSRRTQKLAWLWLSIDLLWVHPNYRACGYGKHLVAHLLRYIRARMKAARHPPVARQGVEVVVHAEIHSETARRLMQLVYEEFVFLKELAASGVLDPGAWRIRSVDIEED